MPDGTRPVSYLIILVNEVGNSLDSPQLVRIAGGNGTPGDLFYQLFSFIIRKL